MSDSPVDLLRHEWNRWSLTHPKDPDPLGFSAFSFNHNTRDYRVVIVRHGDDEVQFHVSPTGRSVQIHVNGERVR